MTLTDNRKFLVEYKKDGLTVTTLEGKPLDSGRYERSKDNPNKFGTMYDPANSVYRRVIELEPEK